MPHAPHENPVQLPMVVLRHELPNGSFHFDWMFARENPAVTKLITLRTCERPDECRAGQRIEVERIGDHRIVYLNYEGQVSGNRGSVTRVAAGYYEDLNHPEDPWGTADTSPIHLQIRWNEQLQQIQRWVIDLVSATAELTNIKPTSKRG